METKNKTAHSNVLVDEYKHLVKSLCAIEARIQSLNIRLALTVKKNIKGATEAEYQLKKTIQSIYYLIFIIAERDLARRTKERIDRLNK